MNSAAPSGESPAPGQEDPAGEATVLRMLLGAQLRRLRDAADISAEKAGYQIRASRSKISRMETVPGLFQTRDYARAVTRLGHKSALDEDVERRVGLRLGRQNLLARPQPPRVWAVMDEAVLRRPWAVPR